VARFDELWRSGQDRLEELLRLLDVGVTLTAPGLRSTHGREAARKAFRLTFRMLPDLRARVNHWRGDAGLLFIDMTFSVRLPNGSRFTWDSVDRIRFANGRAIERVAYHDPAPVRQALRGP
jgi:ketosteroid isomerase-like protein